MLILISLIRKRNYQFVDFKSSLPIFVLLQVWAALVMYRQILDEIEANDYNNFTKIATVSKPKKILALQIAYAKSLLPPSSTSSTLAKL